MSLNQTKAFFNYLLVSAIRNDAVILIHDPVLGDVNMRICDLLSALGTLSDTMPILTDTGGTGKRCVPKLVITRQADDGSDVWEWQLTTIIGP